jgi:hypothetical protein
MSFCTDPDEEDFATTTTTVVNWSILFPSGDSVCGSATDPLKAASENQQVMALAESGQVYTIQVMTGLYDPYVVRAVFKE